MVKPKTKRQKTSHEASSTNTTQPLIASTASHQSALIPNAATSSSAATPSKQSGALRLPREILTQILSHALVQESQPITLHSASRRRWNSEINALHQGWLFEAQHEMRTGQRFLRRIHKSSTLLRVLLVCRAFYFSCIEAFYGGNRLAFDDVKHLTDFARRIDVDRRRCVKRIELAVGWVSDLPHPTLSLCGQPVLYNPQPLLSRTYEPFVLDGNPLAGFPALQEAVVVVRFDWDVVSPGPELDLLQVRMENDVKTAWDAGFGRLLVRFK